MGNLLMKVKIAIDYLENLKNENYTQTKIFIMRQDKLQKMIINKKEHFFENKLTESIGKPKDLWKALWSLGLPSKTSCQEVNALKIRNTVEHDVNSILEDFRDYYSILV